MGKDQHLENSTVPSIKKSPQRKFYPVSLQQEGVYLQSVIDPHNTVWNTSHSWRYEGRLNIDALKNAIKELINRQASLRTNFQLKGDTIVQVIHEEVSLDSFFQLSDLTSYPEEQREKTAKSIEEKEAKKPYDLNSGPLIRFVLVRFAQDDHLLIIGKHHIISDVASRQIILKELAVLYNGYHSGTPHELAAIEIQYYDYALWQREFLLSPHYRQQKDYWLKRLSGTLPLLNLPADSPRGTVARTKVSTCQLVMEKELTKKLRTFGLRNRVTFSSLFLLAYYILLNKYTAQVDIIIGAMFRGRNADKKHLNPLVGLFANRLAMRIDMDDRFPVKELLKEVDKKNREAYSNQDFLFEDLVRTLKPERTTEHAPVFQAAFNLLKVTRTNAQFQALTPKEWQGFELDTNISLQYDLSLFVRDESNKIILKLLYPGDLFKKETLERMLTRFIHILQDIVNRPEKRLSGIEVISEAEKRQIVYEFNNTEAPFPGDKTIHGLFADQVERTPDNIAVVGSNSKSEIQNSKHHITYRQLDKKAGQTAYLLRSKGVKPGSIVGIMAERSIEMIAGIFGIVKAGGAYLPIDPGYPQERINYIMADSGAEILFATEVTSFEITEEKFFAATCNLQPAYVIYTSGSTGKPKGVIVEHRSLVNRLNWMQKKYPIDSNDLILHKTPFTFDVSVWEIFWWAIAGAGVCLLGPGGEKEPQQIVGAIYRNRVTVMHFVPSMLGVFLEYIKESKEVDLKMLASLKQVIASGEALTVSQVASFNLLLYKENRTALANLYGPTEAAIDVSFYDCPLGENMQRIPIGKPIDNIKLFVMNKENCLQPVGVGGELCISGVGLARGYLNKPEMTAEKFFDLTAKTREEARRIYKTGDLARWLPDGNIEFLGRIDNQVKIRGFRIELGEIESALRTYPGIKESAVLAKENKNLCAYVVCKDNLDVQHLREFLSNRLPGYMVPAYFIPLDRMPLTANGKIDRKALPEPGTDGTIFTGAVYEAPHNDVQEKMAAVWEEVLGLEKIGINDNFITLGGESIKAIQVISKLSAHGYKLDIAQLFKHLTIKDVSEYVSQISGEIDQSVVTGNINLIPIQEWFVEKDFAGKHHWNLAVLLYREEGFEAELLEKVFEAILAHHDVLRAVLSADGRVLINKGTEEENLNLSLEIIDLRAEDDPENRVNREANRIQGSIDLFNGPLLKTGLFKTKQGDHLLIVIHHLVIDGISWRILFEDIAAGYEQVLQGRQMEFPLKTHSFKQWSEALQRYSRSHKLLQHYDYWKDLCEHGVTPLFPPGDKKKSKLKDYHRYKIELDKEESLLLLNEAHRAYNTGINDLLLSGLSLAVRDCFGNGKVIINLEGHGREDIFAGIDISRTVGWFTALFPILLEARKDDDLSMHIRRTKESLREIPGRGIGYGLLRYLSNLPEADRHILEIEPEIGFNYLGRFDEDLSRSGFQRSPYGVGDSKNPESQQVYKININGMMVNSKLTFTINGDSGTFKEKEIETFGESFKAKIQTIITHCAGMEETFYTPADFDAPGLSIEELETVYRCFDRGNIRKIYNLSPMQEGMLFHYLYDSRSRAYTVQLVYLLEGEIDTGLFRKSCEILVDTYDVFRTAFIYKEVKQPRQVVLKERKKEYSYRDISGAADTGDALEQITVEEQDRGFDLRDDLLIRFTLIKTGSSAYSLLMTYHHIIMDGWSTNLVLKAFVDIYRHLKKGDSQDLDFVYPYGSYIQWLENQDIQAANAYWRNYLEGFDRVSGIQAYDDEHTPAVEEYKKADYDIGIDGEIRNLLVQSANRMNVTLNNLLQGVWAVVLHRYGGGEDVVFGNVISGRNVQVEGIDRIIGLFINTVPVRVTVKPGQRFDETVKEIGESLVESQRYGYLPLAEIQGYAAAAGQLFQHLFIYENYPVSKETRSPGLIEKIGFKITGRQSLEHTNYHLNIVIIPRDELRIRFQYNEYVYSFSQVSRLAGHVQRIIEQVMNDPVRHISDMEIITAEEKQQLLAEFNDTAADYPGDRTIHGLFADQVERTPDNIAVEGSNPKSEIQNSKHHITYRQLDKKAGQTAYLLRSKGVKPGSIVGIMAERSIEMIVGIFGIVKAGAAYLPIDPGYPRERINYIMADSGAEILLTMPDLANGITYETDIVRFADAINHVPTPKPIPIPAYVIYTSGSTGKPKGVIVEHRSLVNRLNWMQKKYPIDSGDVILHKTPFTFDVSVWEIFWWAMEGARVCLLGPGGEKDPQQIVEAVSRDRVTVMHFVPSMLNIFLEYIKETRNVNIRILASLRRVITSGEALTVSQVRSFNTLLNKENRRVLANLYGPTEATIDVSFYDCPPEKNIQRIPIGKPIDNIRLFVVSKENHFQPIGVAGELCIAGVCLARGYLNNPELTAEKFFDLTAKTREETRRIYKTGDLARWLPDGNIEYLGRMDFQVKVRGFRIELGEIESVLAEHPGIREAVVTAVSDDRGENTLYAYIAGDKSLTVKELRTHLEKQLPGYMVPAYFIPLDHIPLTPNGKLDRKALPAPDRTLETGTAFEAPKDEIEEKLVSLWQEILKVKQVGVKDNFFELGGHSLKIMALSAAIYKAFGLDIQLKVLFDHPFIREIVHLIREEDEQQVKLNRILEEIESLTEEQVQALLENE